MKRKKNRIVKQDSLLSVLPYIWISIASLILWFVVECIIGAFKYKSEPIIAPVIEYRIGIEDDITTQPINGGQNTKNEYSDEIDGSIDAECFEYLVRCVEAEAGDQPELGKRMVCSVILNRYDQGSYNSLIEVINTPGQFSVVSDGRIHKVTPTEETYLAVGKELKSRTNDKVLYFRADRYHSFGIPLFIIGDHYFSM